MHIMQALVGCQKRSTKSLTRSLQPIAGVRGMRGSFVVSASYGVARSRGKKRSCSTRPIVRWIGRSARMKALKIVVGLLGALVAVGVAGWFSLDRETRGVLATLPTNSDVLFWSQAQRDAA